MRAETIAIHSGFDSDCQMPEAEQRKAGVTPEGIRLSIGIEHKDDIIADIAQVLAAGGQMLRAAE